MLSSAVFKAPQAAAPAIASGPQTLQGPWVNTKILKKIAKMNSQLSNHVSESD